MRAAVALIGETLWHMLEGVAVIATVLFLLGWMAREANAHDPYMRWQRPDTGGACCSGNPQTGDCRPVRAYMHDDGLWRARTPSGWIVIPPAKVLRFTAPDGNAHLCE